MPKRLSFLISRQGSTHPFHQPSVMVGGFVVHETPIARNMGVHMDQHVQLI